MFGVVGADYECMVGLVLERDGRDAYVEPRL